MRQRQAEREVNEMEKLLLLAATSGAGNEGNAGTSKTNVQRDIFISLTYCISIVSVLNGVSYF